MLITKTNFTKMTTNKLFFNFILLISFIGNSIAQDNIVDKSFTGAWMEVGAETFRRVDILPDNAKGFLINSDEKLIRTVDCNEVNLCTYQGVWWSFNMNHFDIQYVDDAVGFEVVERFEYKGSKDIIEHVGYEKYHLVEKSQYPGSWKMISKDENSGKVIYEKCDNIDSENFAFFLDTEDASIIYKTNKKNKKFASQIDWWIGEEGDNIDLQFYNKISKKLVIEGFTIVPNSNPLQLLRTRMDVLE